MRKTLFFYHKWIESWLERKRWLVIADYNQFPPTPTLGSRWVAQWTKELKRMMSRFDFRLKCRVKSTFQSVDAKYELCACELDQNVEMYCNCVWWGGGPSIHAVAITWVEKAAASIIKKLLLVPTFGVACIHPLASRCDRFNLWDPFIITSHDAHQFAPVFKSCFLNCVKTSWNREILWDTEHVL